MRALVFLAVVIIAVFSGCTEIDLCSSFGICTDTAFVKTISEQLGPKDVVTISEAYTIPKSPIPPDNTLMLTFVVENHDANPKRLAENVVVDLYDAPTFKDTGGIKCNSKPSELCTPVQCSKAQPCKLLPTSSKPVTMSLRSPTEKEINNIVTKPTLSFKVNYDFSSSTLYDVVVVNPREIIKQQKAGKQLPLSQEIMYSSGPVKITAEVQGERYVLGDGTMDAVIIFTVKDEGSGTLKGGVVEPDKMRIHFPEGLAVIGPDGHNIEATSTRQVSTPGSAGEESKTTVTTQPATSASSSTKTTQGKCEKEYGGNSYDDCKKIGTECYWKYQKIGSSISIGARIDECLACPSMSQPCSFLTMSAANDVVKQCQEGRCGATNCEWKDDKCQSKNAITTAVVASAITGMATASKCSDCGAGISNICDRQECLGLGDNCYFVDGLISNSCKECPSSPDCSLFSSKEMCDAGRCSLKCKWAGAACVPEAPEEKECKFITNRQQCTLGPADCRWRVIESDADGGMCEPGSKCTGQKTDITSCHDLGTWCYYENTGGAGGTCSKCDASTPCSKFNTQNECGSGRACTSKCEWQGTVCVEKEKKLRTGAGVVVVLDPGHGSGDNKFLKKTNEADNEGDHSWNMAQLVKAKLEKKGYVVYLTKDSASANPTLADRVKFANQKSPDIFVSLHSNAKGGEGAVGIVYCRHSGVVDGDNEVNYKDDSFCSASQKTDNEKKLSRKIVSELKKNLGLSERYWGSDLGVLDGQNAPAVLIEMFAHDEEKDLNKISGKDYLLASSIADGIAAYLSEAQAAAGTRYVAQRKIFTCAKENDEVVCRNTEPIELFRDESMPLYFRIKGVPAVAIYKTYTITAEVDYTYELRGSLELEIKPWSSK